jgi:hypothetical protein
MLRSSTQYQEERSGAAPLFMARAFALAFARTLPQASLQADNVPAPRPMRFSATFWLRFNVSGVFYLW